ncbi:hypothetical protein MUK42_20706 [Musa troglodytarum]|uniref:Uncharacterized protein n=1 Tax=Musa troglodytarum TaxID=320322 RepID=A0A9E7JRQ5_9LILI|nr:hypothetical protein MUK42_20706 [Musa troglodytarum]
MNPSFSRHPSPLDVGFVVLASAADTRPRTAASLLCCLRPSPPYKHAPPTACCIAPSQSQAPPASPLSFAMAASSFARKVSLLLLLVLVLAEISAQEHSPAPGPAPAMDNGAVGGSPGACAVALASIMSFVALLAR